MTDFDTLFDATNNESGIIIFPNNDVIIGNWTYSGHGVPRLSPFGDTLVSTGTIDKAEDKGLVNIKDYLTGLDGFDIVYDRNDDYPQIKADDMARLWEIVNNDETLRVFAPVDWN